MAVAIAAAATPVAVLATEYLVRQLRLEQNDNGLLFNPLTTETHPYAKHFTGCNLSLADGHG